MSMERIQVSFKTATLTKFLFFVAFLKITRQFFWNAAFAPLFKIFDNWSIIPFKKEILKHQPDSLRRSFRSAVPRLSV